MKAVPSKSAAFIIAMLAALAVVKPQIYDSVNGQEVIHAVLRPGDIIGEMALIDDRPRSASARASSAATVVVVPRKLFLHELERTPSIIRKLVASYIDIIRNRNRRL
jgi:CRP-like cAMP-binding protein